MDEQRSTAPEPAILENVSVLALGSVLLERRRTLIAVPLVLAVITYLICSVWPRSYTASVMLAPGSGAPAVSPLAGLAAQFGVAAGASGVGGGDYYAQVLTGHHLLASVIQARYPNPEAGAGEPDSITLFEYYDEGGSSAADSLARAIKAFRKHLVVRANNAAGIFTVDVDTHHPALTLAVSEKVLEALTVFNAVTRGSSARARRIFLAERLAAARDSFERAQAVQQRFLETNRTWQSSPRLAAEKTRLDVELALRTQVYQTLASQYESARIDEVNDTPVLTVVDGPMLPTIPSSPRRRLLTALAFVLGVLIAFAAVVAQEFHQRLKAGGSQDYARLRALSSAAFGGLSRRWQRWFGRGTT